MFFGDDNMGMLGGMHAVGWLLWLLLIAVVVAWGWSLPRQREGRRRETAREILDRRLANGDMTPADYQERLGLLERDAATAVSDGRPVARERQQGAGREQP